MTKVIRIVSGLMSFAAARGIAVAETDAPLVLNSFSAEVPILETAPHPAAQTLLAVYCLLIVAASVAGGWLPSIVRLTHARMQGMISFVGGLMLGIGLFHLLPHAIDHSGSVDDSVHWMMFGILTMFLLMRAFHVHHHGPLELPGQSGTVIADSYRHELQPAALPTATAAHTHDHDAGHDHDHGEHGGHHSHVHQMSWLGIALGLGLHTLIDGMLLGASVRADASGATAFSLFGFGTFLAVALHKPLDALSITSLMAAAGWSRSSRNLVNAAFAIVCPLGAILFLVGVDLVEAYQQEIVASGLAFAAGVFVCISLGDLLPEMEFHSHSRLPLTAALVTGIALAWAITFLEPGHLH